MAKDPRHVTSHCPITSMTSLSSLFSELPVALRFPLLLTSTGPRRLSKWAEGEEGEGEDAEELEALLGGYLERKLDPAGPGVAAKLGSPPGCIAPG